MFDRLKDVAAQEVERLEAALPDTIMGIDGRVSALSERSLADVEASYRGSITAGNPAVNAELAELLTYVRSEAAACVLNLRKIERFIVLHVPKVEDGNNFGVAIQMETNKMVQVQGLAVKALLDKLPDYHKDRAAAWKAGWDAIVFNVTSTCRGRPHRVVRNSPRETPVCRKNGTVNVSADVRRMVPRERPSKWPKTTYF